MKNKYSQNGIRCLTTEQGEQILTDDKTTQEVIGFYKRLPRKAATTLPIVDLNIIKEGPILNIEQERGLISLVTREEVWQILKDIEDMKAPGCDGFNAFIFKKTWPIVGDEVTEAMLEFFNEAEMFKPINCTSVTLIPKVRNPTSIKEYIHISCCTILYKIISKILTKKLQVVMDDLVDNSQSAFVPGRVITDNIILSHELIKGYGRKELSPRCMMKLDMQKAYDSIE